MTRMRLQGRGFTLIELMVTLTIAAVLALVVAPGLTAYKRNAELTSAINTLLSAVNAARSEAMKRGMKAMVIPADGRSLE
jgi:type IV fimbrial biogenesis protein FimT